jgi:hypothetical protein
MAFLIGLLAGRKRIRKLNKEPGHSPEPVESGDQNKQETDNRTPNAPPSQDLLGLHEIEDTSSPQELVSPSTIHQEMQEMEEQRKPRELLGRQRQEMPDQRPPQELESPSAAFRQESSKAQKKQKDISLLTGLDRNEK